ncbi:MASE3 domain-containing protein [Planctomycetota bacterium]
MRPTHVGGGLLVLAVLAFISRQNYLLFHCIVEGFSVVVAVGIFALVWNSRVLLDNTAFLCIGIAYLFVGLIDGIHTLAYSGMGVFEGYDANLPTQLWIGARYMESLSLLAALLLFRRRLKPAAALLGYAVVTSTMLAAVFHWRVFPVCLAEGVGLTPFKKISEYVISLVLVGAIAMVYRRREVFTATVRRLLIASIMVTLAFECFCALITASCAIRKTCEAAS